MTGAGNRSRWWLYLLLTVALLVVVTPFIWMVLGSFKSNAELRQVPPTWWPENPTLENFGQLFSRLSFGTYFRNSTVVAVVVTVGNLLFCSMVGYALAMLRFRGKRLIFALILGTLMIPGVVTFVPLFVLVANLGLVDTLPGLFLPFLVGPFGVFLMRQFVLGLPKDLVEAARIDGAGEFRIFFQVILPLLTPALATLGILTFLGSWNNFLWPLVVAQTNDTYTLPVALALYSTGQNEQQYGLLMAGATIVVLPVLVVFLIFQRRFIQGIATTGIK
ncbi:N-Acetyl-D-glucosamine ABC transport system, permease protein 2 [Serinicoccus hydrothermalis]|uniref:N-Acetyl-D-glucosamine ABC transport system, permease protein 2 n=1 Tax=Serinicoccus hydrothermalis TaxID=1758689 RepID=A0A1B1NCK8_9MICO|nr:carbohydrate ABC transporter permease [Serinicoccus hydrothermalis]ANS79163.1 N-Acetyl-D-glucosamine ABC transport system, permease protein 2 [Serinicoccus hydrothermalis]